MAKQFKGRSRGKQSRKDSSTKRVNYDNAREDKFEKDTKDFRSNDVSWYAHNSELLRSAASLPFSAVTGKSLPFTSGDAVPGVMGIYYVPTIGPNIDNFKPINQAANSMYSFTVHANSRNQSYDAPDEMLLVLAGAQLFSFLALGVRCYGVAKLYDQRNNYLPDALIQAMGFDPASVRNSLSQMWFDLNEFIARAAQIWIPNTMPLIARWWWMNSNVYMDGDSVKAQYYLYAPAVVYRYNETKYTSGGCLEPISWDSAAQSVPGSGATWAQYKAALNSLFNALLDSQDRGIIFGDILKAYGADKLYSLSEIPSDYTVVPVHDPEVLSQIENSTAISVKLGDVTQTPPTPGATELILHQMPSVQSTAPTMSNEDFTPITAILNFHQKEVPTPEQIMVATRMMALDTIATPESGTSNYQVYPRVIGTEYVYKYGIVGRRNGVLNTSLFGSVFNFTTNEISRFWRLSAMDWVPFMYGYSADPTASSMRTTTMATLALGEYDNYTTIEYEELAKMHETAVYSEFGVPVI